LKCGNERNGGQRSVKSRRYSEYPKDLEREILPHEVIRVNNLAIGLLRVDDPEVIQGDNSEVIHLSRGIMNITEDQFFGISEYSNSVSMWPI
jgi:hypothetical protein